MKALGFKLGPTTPSGTMKRTKTVVSNLRVSVIMCGGLEENALAYRSLLPVAAMYRSIPMIVDLLAVGLPNGVSVRRILVQKLSGQRGYTVTEPDGGMENNV